MKWRFWNSKKKKKKLCCYICCGLGNSQPDSQANSVIFLSTQVIFWCMYLPIYVWPLTFPFLSFLQEICHVSMNIAMYPTFTNVCHISVYTMSSIVTTRSSLQFIPPCQILYITPLQNHKWYCVSYFRSHQVISCHLLFIFATSAHSHNSESAPLL